MSADSKKHYSTGNNFYEAPINMAQLSTPFEPYIQLIKECLKKHSVSLSSNDGDIFLDGVTERNWAAVMADLNNTLKVADRIARLPELREFVGNTLKKKVKPFIINKVRINTSTTNKSAYSWHQDQATWPGMLERYPQLKGADIYTLWLCLSNSDEKNGLLLAPKNHKGKLLEHSFVESQGYFNTDSPLLSEAGEHITVYGPPFTGAIFGQNILHKSLNGSSKTRISLDLRYYCV